LTTTYKQSHTEYVVKILPKKKKFILTLVVVVALLLLGEFVFGGPGGPFEKPPTDSVERKAWLSQKIKSQSKDVVNLDHKTPSWKELNETAASLPQENTYPKFIKALQTYGTEANIAEVLYFGDEIKDLGVNTHFIHFPYHMSGGKLKHFFVKTSGPFPASMDEAKRITVDTILMAKSLGLSVIFFPDYHDLEDGGMEKFNISADELEDMLEKVTLELAPLAEEYNVDYFVPVNQIEAILSSNNYSKEKTVKRTNAFYARIIPKLKELYTGKIMYKMGGIGGWSPYEDISLEGADLFGFTGCYNKNNHDLDFVTADIKEASGIAGKLSRKYNIPWINAEFVVTDQQSYNNFGENTKDYSLAEYYQAGFKAFNRYAVNQGATGFTVHSFLMDGKIYDTPAFPIIKTFFASKP
jgi:hypothetical protein